MLRFRRLIETAKMVCSLVGSVLAMRRKEKRDAASNVPVWSLDPEREREVRDMLKRRAAALRGHDLPKRNAAGNGAHIRRRAVRAMREEKPAHEGDR